MSAPPFEADVLAVHERQREEADISDKATGAEWVKLRHGEQSERYFSLVRVHPDRPCPTVTTATAFSIGAAGVAHPDECRKFTIPELRRLSGFPDDFLLPGSYRSSWERLGRAVAPPVMEAVASALADLLLKGDDREE